MKKPTYIAVRHKCGHFEHVHKTVLTPSYEKQIQSEICESCGEDRAWVSNQHRELANKGN